MTRMFHALPISVPAFTPSITAHVVRFHSSPFPRPRFETSSASLSSCGTARPAAAASGRSAANPWTPASIISMSLPRAGRMDMTPITRFFNENGGGAIISGTNENAGTIRGAFCSHGIWPDADKQPAFRDDFLRAARMSRFCPLSNALNCFFKSCC